MDQETRALLEELQQADGPGAETPAIQAKARELIGSGRARDLDEALGQLFRADPEIHKRHRQSFQKRTKEREGLVVEFSDEEIAPLVRGLQTSGLSGREASDAAWRCLPAVYAARNVMLEKARNGASVLELARGHKERTAMVRRLVVEVLRKQLASAQAGERLSFRKAFDTVLGGRRLELEA